jgi:hypothetical protein
MPCVTASARNKSGIIFPHDYGMKSCICFEAMYEILCAATLPAQDTNWEPQPASLALPNSSRPGNNDRSQEQGTCARSSRDAVGHLAVQSK